MYFQIGRSGVVVPNIRGWGLFGQRKIHEYLFVAPSAQTGAMITTIEISADSVDHARQAAIDQARAQGYTRIEAVFTTPIGDRLYRVQMTVSR